MTNLANLLNLRGLPNYMITGFEEYKPIRNYMRKFDRLELLTNFLIISQENSRDNNILKSNGYLPWEILLALRWVILDWHNITGSQLPDIKKCKKILNSIKYFQEKEEKFLKKDYEMGIVKFTRKYAYQQFWMQETPDYRGIARTVELFSNSGFSKIFDKIFQSHFEVARIDFYRILILLFSIFINSNLKFINENHLQSLYPEMKSGCLAVLRKLSIGISDFEEFNNTNPVTNYSLQIFEKSTLLKKPFYSQGGNYYPWNLSLLNYFISYGSYDLIKEVNPELFGDEFGKIFESYIENRLKHYKTHYITEKEQTEAESKKKVDFILKGAQQQVLIEAKSIEAKKHESINSTKQILKNRYGENIVKAVAQADSYLSATSNTKPNRDTFLIIVSYKELYLGNGESVWKEFIAELLKERFEIADSYVDPKKIFIMPIGAFDKLLNYTGGNTERIIQVLVDCQNAQKLPETTRFVFDQYLEDKGEEYFSRTQDKHLENIYETFFDHLIDSSRQ